MKDQSKSNAELTVADVFGCVHPLCPNMDSHTLATTAHVVEHELRHLTKPEQALVLSFMLMALLAVPSEAIAGEVNS